MKYISEENQQKWKTYFDLRKEPYRLRRALILITNKWLLVIYDFTFNLIEWILIIPWVLLSKFFILSPNKSRNGTLVYLWRNKFFSASGKEESTEKFMLDDTLNEIDVNLKVFYWDSGIKLIAYQINFFNIILFKCPDVVILSSYSYKNRFQPPIFLLKEIKRRKDLKIVLLWWDTCSENFINSIKPLIPIVDLHVVNDNPTLNLKYGDLSEYEKNKFVAAYSPLNANNFKQFEKSIDVCFLGQIDSYRSYRREYILYLMKNNVAGFFSTFNRDNQPSHEEYYEIMAKSKICINFSYSVDKHQLKGRVFDSMLSGTMLLESENPQISTLFSEGIDYAAFSSKEDLLKKIRYYLENEDERLKIAENGRKKCLKYYNSKVYWNTVLSKIGL